MIAVLLFLAGVILYTLVEYATHRWILHGPLIAHHRMHHQHPELPETLSWQIVVVVILAVVALFGFALALGLLFGWVVSKTIHARLHEKSPAPSWVQRLKAHHEGHHKRASTNYGVTNTLWDRVFRTRSA